ncbi:MAG: DUF799 family lipoprotein [Deltaproteobacteria bacterium]|nr:DUF799 family lipoprotein [Deltaproteobacteria bacterium]
MMRNKRRQPEARKKSCFSFYCLLLTAYCLLFFSGCGGALQHTLAPDYNRKMPRVIAVLPVAGDIQDKDASYLFRTLAQEKLIQMGYSPLPLEAVDDKLLRSGITRDGVHDKTPGELAAIIGADAVLYTTITKWDSTLFLHYASQRIAVKFALYNSAAGERLWEAKFDTKDSDINLEKSVVELGVIKAYEPVIQRVVDTAFSTIPMSKIIIKERPQKGYYDWLP